MTKMKHSGIDWIGEIPEHWEVKRLKDIFTESKDVSTTGTEDLLSVSEYYGVARRLDIKEEDEFDSRAESLIDYKICCKDDLVINIMLAWKRGLGFSNYDGIVSPAYAVYKGKNIIPHYYHYLLRTDRYIAEFKRNSKGIIDSRLRLYSDKFFKIDTIYPPLHEQQAIANYLDEKTAEIDAQVSALEQKQDAYKRLKQSLISETITKGLNPNAPRRESGIDWIGEIPEHWEVKRLKEYTDIIFGQSPDGDDIEEFGNIPFMQGKADFTSKYPQSKMFCDNCLKHSRVGDILMSIRAPIGDINISDKVYGIGRGLCSIKPIKINSEYLWFYLKSAKSFIESLGTGSTFLAITGSDLSIVPIIFPPLQEQQVIANYLDAKTAEIDAQMELIDKKIDAYKCLKQSLIDEVVTGKRKIS